MPQFLEKKMLIRNNASTTTTNNLFNATWLITALLLLMALALPLGAHAQGSYVYVDNQGPVNTVSAFSVSPTGALIEVAGSPFATGGSGLASPCIGLNRITIAQGGSLLFVSNSGEQTISAFSINPATGALTAAPGSPFPSILPLDSCQGISLAATPDGLYLMAASNSVINTFSIGAGGTLTPLTSTVSCCSQNTGMKIFSNAGGQFLALSNLTSVSVFSIAQVNGALTQVPGSPFLQTGTGSIAGLEASCAGDHLYGAETGLSGTMLTDAWTVSTTGVLTPMASSPFSAQGSGASTPLLTPDNETLFQNGQFSNTISSASVLSDGSLTDIALFGGLNFSQSSAGMAMDASGTFLFVADDAFGVASLRMNAGSTLTGLADLPINRAGDIRDLVTYPTRSCTTTHLAIGMTANPNPTQPGAPIVFTISVQNTGTVPSSAVVSDILPANLAAGGRSPIVASGGALRTNTLTTNAITGLPVVNGVVTITTAVPNQVFVGETVSITAVGDPSTDVPDPNNPSATIAMGDPGFNGNYQVVSATPTSFTYNQSFDPTVFTGPQISIVPATGAVRASGVTTITTTAAAVAPYTFNVGDPITVAGVIDGSFNGTFTITAATATSVSYAQTGLADTISGDGSVTPLRAVPASDASGLGTVGTQICSSQLPPPSVPGTGICGQSTFAATASIVPSTGISSVSNMVTVTTVLPHHVFAGGQVTLANVPPVPVPGSNPPAFANFNGTFTVVASPAPTANTFSFILAVPNVTGGGGTVLAPQSQIQLVTFPTLAPGETQSATITATPIASVPLGGTVTNTAVISNKSTIDSAPGSNFASASATLTTAAASATTLTLPTATATYGGSATMTATLARADNGLGIPGETITFTFNGVTGTATTDHFGTATFFAPTYNATAGTTIPVGTTAGAVSASFAGDAVFAGSAGTGSLTVTKGVLTVVPAAVSRVYGSANPATFTFAITGFQNNDTAASVVSGAPNCTNTTALVTSPVGNYVIACNTGNLTAANYTFTAINGTLTITQAPLNITANDASRDFGAADPVFTGVITGLLNSDVITATYSTTATSASGVGTYPIIPAAVGTPAVLANYSITLVNGTLTINPVVVSNAPLTVTVNSVARFYGDPNPALSATITGALNGDVFTATPSTAATTASSVGAFPITATVSGPTANYVVTVIPGTLTINPAPLVVTVANATRLYGGADPAFTGTIGATKNGDVITATYATAATVTSDVGTFAITPTLAGAALGNYAVTVKGGVYTITPAPLAITAVGGARLYGGATPAATITGLLNGDPITTTYTFPTAATPVGVYTLSPTIVDPAGKIGDYAVTIKTATLTINRAPLTITASPASRPFGSANPALVAVFGAGQIQNGDPITPLATTTATAASNAGTYPITATFNDPASLISNYAVTAVNSTLTVTPAPLTITADAKSMILNNPIPTFTATYAGFVLGQGPTNLGGTLKCSATTTGGLHPITCSGQSSTNYAITFVPGTLTVNYSAACKNGPGLTILSPLAPNPPLPTFSKATTASVPVSFRGCDAKGNSVGSTIIAPTIAGGPGSVTLIDPNGANVAAAAPTFGFSFANTAWTFNFTTAGRTTGTYTGTVTLNDGSVIPFSFSLTN
jgi:hypothetical protein